MSVSSSVSLAPVLEAAIHAARMKGISVAVARSSQPVEQIFLGTDATGMPLTADSLFPVASVTKLATALSVLRLIDVGRLAIDDPLARHIPEAVAAGHWGVTLRRLLSHTSGLPLDVPAELAPYAIGLTWPTLKDACIQTPLRHEPGRRVQYSNVGYGLLAMVVEREMGQDFASALEQLVLRPLGIEGYLGAEPPRMLARLGGVRGHHAKTDLETFNSPFWRSLAMPWAGLVTTAAGALALVRAFSGHTDGFIKPALVAEATRNQNGDMGGGFVRPLVWKRCPWGLGPEIRDQKVPHWVSPAGSEASFGHSGASGCFAWYDPEFTTAWAVLGTRVVDSGWLVRMGPEISATILGVPLAG